MKIYLCTITLVFMALPSMAQNGQVSIKQDQRITALLNIYKTSNSTINYYKIQVGFGSHTEAQQIKSNVEQDFPSLPTKIDFDSPTYRVRLGRFKTKLEGERKLMEVRKKYPEAMLLKPKATS